MKFGRIAGLVCIMTLGSGCASIGNRGIAALSKEEKAEMRQELNEALDEVQGVLDEAQAELRAELQDPEWIAEMIGGKEGERPRRVIWRKGSAEAEIEDRAAFTKSLSLKDWVYSEESTEGLEEQVVYTVEDKRSVGLLDGRKGEYDRIGTITVYADSNLISVELIATDSFVGKLANQAMEKWMGSGLEDWNLTFVYEAPEDAVQALRQ